MKRNILFVLFAMIAVSCEEIEPKVEPTESGMSMGLYVFNESNNYLLMYIPKHIEIGESTWFVEKSYNSINGLSIDWYDQIETLGEPEFYLGRWQILGHAVKNIKRINVDTYQISIEEWYDLSINGTYVVSQECKYDYRNQIFNKIISIDGINEKYKFVGNKTITQYLEEELL